MTCLICAGIYFTYRTRFVQIRCFKEGICNIFRKKQQKDSISSFQALSAAIAAQVGTGNIVGIAGAILTGGPGAVFWMWLIAFFGMATIYAEAVLAQTTRVINTDGSVQGGPVYYIKKALPGKTGNFLAAVFAFAAIIAFGFMGGMVQANAIGETGHDASGIPAWCIGLVTAAAAAAVFSGGAKRLTKVTGKIVPFMALLYIAGGIYVLIMRWQFIPETACLIFKYAFMPDALLGGTIGYALKTAVSQGVKRGLFSNEAGMGSTPHAHALAQVSSPHEQGTVAIIGVFIDTMIVLTMSAFILISVLYTGNGPLAGATAENYNNMISAAGLTQTNLVSTAVAAVSNNVTGKLFVAICLFFFAFSTIVSWNYFGRINFHYLTGGRCLWIYSILSVGFIFAGTVLKSDLVWALQDMSNQLLVLPNIIALFLLSAAVAASSRPDR